MGNPVGQREVEFDRFTRSTGAAVRRALVACFGVEIGTEAAAEALAVAWERWDDLAAMSNPSGYLFRIGQSKARPSTRWARRRGTFPLSEPATHPAELPDPDVLAALGRLTPTQRSAVVLVKSHGYSYREVAEMLDVSEAAVTNHVHRGMARLRSILEVE